MNKKLLHIIAVCLLLLQCTTLSAQVQVEQKLDSLQMLIGQQTKLTLTVNARKGAKIEFPKFNAEEELIPGVEVLGYTDTPARDLDHGMNQYQRVYLLTSFDQNVYAIPALPVKVDNNKHQGNPSALKVLTVKVDTVHTNKFYPPKGVQDNPFQAKEWFPLYGFSILLLILIVALIYLAIRLVQHKPIITRMQIVRHIPAHTKALNEINVIKTIHAESQDAQKAYYSELTDTLRKYIKERFGFNATEMTSSEIISHLREKGDEKMLMELRDLFTTADLVKFARYQTLMNENDMNLVNAVKFIDETKTSDEIIEERIVPELSENDKKSKSTRTTLWIVTAVVGVITVTTLGYIIYQLVMLLM